MEKSAVISVSNFLSEDARKERRNLLGISAISIAMTHAKLVPQEVTALGIKFAESDQKRLLLVVAFVVAYFLVAFVIYAVADFSIWRIKFSSINTGDVNAVRSRIVSDRSDRDTEDYDYRPDDDEIYLSKDEYERFKKLLDKVSRINKRWVGLSPFISAIRTIFDFALPIAVSVYAIASIFAFKG